MDLEDARRALQTLESFGAEGIGRPEIARRCERGEILKLHAGRWVDAELFEGLHAEQRHLMRIAAVIDLGRGSQAVFSHVSAAVLHQLPVPRHPLDKVHRSGLTLRGSTIAPGLLATHDVEVTADDACLAQGVPTTDLARTVLDIARSCRAETALSVADAALRRVAACRRAYDREAAERFRHDLKARLLDLAGGRGVVAARRVVALADGRADLPGESITRLYLTRLGFRDLRLQVPVPGPRGTDYACDIGVEDVKAFVEFDGVGKYVDAGMTAGRSAREVVVAEKEREDWIRSVTGRPVVRVMWPDIASPDALAALLRRHGIRPRA